MFEKAERRDFEKAWSQTSFSYEAEMLMEIRGLESGKKQSEAERNLEKISGSPSSKSPGAGDFYKLHDSQESFDCTEGLPDVRRFLSGAFNGRQPVSSEHLWGDASSLAERYGREGFLCA